MPLQFNPRRLEYVQDAEATFLNDAPFGLHLPNLYFYRQRL